MKKTTSEKLTERLIQYSALSVAIAGTANVNGQIIYNDIPDYTGGNPDPFYIIDFNSDSLGDLVIFGAPFSSAPSLGFVQVVSYSSGLGSFLGSQAGNYIYPFAMNFGETISAGQTQWFGSNYGTMNWASCYGGFGNSNWCGVTDKYLGLRFKVLNGPGPGDDQVFYGWARLDVSGDGTNWVLKDYAYNSNPGSSILAGDTGVLGINDNVFSNIKVIALNKSIGVYNLQENAHFKVYSMTGQEVLNGTTDHRDYVIETPTLSSGVYVLELTDTNSKGVIRKKVVLQ